MIKDEKDFRRFFCHIIESAHGHVSMVESPETSPGIPDLNWCINGKEGWTELKVSIYGENPHIRPTQKAWIRRRVKVGGFVNLLCYCVPRKTIFNVNGAHVEELNSIGDWERLGKMISPDDFATLFGHHTSLQEH